jgi:hypothetical protein
MVPRAPRVSPPAHRRNGGRTLQIRRWLTWMAVAFLGVAAVVFITVKRHQPLLADDFSQPNGLITNEFAFFNPNDRAAVRSPIWLVTSGSLFAHDGSAWTGVPDVGQTGPRSASATDSSVFRAVTQRADFQNVTVSFGLFVQRFLSAKSGPTPGWEGVHVFLRYQTPVSLYVVSVDRSDGVIVIKKKVPGGPAPSDGGTYYTLASTPGRSVSGRWEQVRVSVVNSGTESVNIRLWMDGKLRLEATDNGIGNVAPITQPGRVGVRGDYTEFKFDHFTVSPG